MCDSESTRSTLRGIDTHKCELMDSTRLSVETSARPSTSPARPGVSPRASETSFVGHGQEAMTEQVRNNHSTLRDNGAESARRDAGRSGLGKPTSESGSLVVS